MSEDGDLEAIIKRAQVQGFRYSKTTKGHHQLYAPNGHDIIIHSGTSSDARGFYNFLAQLKRAGYMELQTLGEAMPKKDASKDEPLPTPDVRGKLSAREHILDLLSRHPSGLLSGDIKAYVKSVRPDLNPESAYSTLHVLEKVGVLTKSLAGYYSLTGKTIEQKKAGRPTGSRPIPLPVPEVFREKEKDTSVDKDLKALDAALNDALNALTKVDNIAQRMKAKLARFAKIQELLK